MGNKVWVVDDYDYGIEHAFSSRESALGYLLGQYVKRILPSMIEIEKERVAGNNSCPPLSESLVDDMKCATESLYIEDFMYIHELTIEQ